jgi:RimJ/RimL family protein N-acetyltransferase
VIRSWRRDDLAALLRHADNPKVAANLRDRFPSPYTEADAEAWFEVVSAETAALHLVIDVAGELVGTIGLEPQSDINAGTAEVGYWLGEAFWGRGFATAALTTLTRHALTALGYRRLYATAFSGNAASRRVLEKAGYRLEGVMRKSAIKRGRVHDQALYAILTEDLGSS